MYANYIFPTKILKRLKSGAVPISVSLNEHVDNNSKLIKKTKRKCSKKDCITITAETIRFFNYPKDPLLRQKWQEICDAGPNVDYKKKLFAVSILRTTTLILEINLNTL